MFTPAEVAAQTGASEWYIRQLARDSRVPHLRVGRQAIRFTEAHRDAVIALLTAAAETAPVASLTTRRSRARRSS